jgi:REP element-mobilizing transposase RayT
MARKLRLEFPGACYHVINRGNYRVDIFKTEGARQAFEACLFEACTRSNWILHAYVLMSNHYHLALETPEPNLVAGMQWLQSTFANRFNKLRGERGHLFQGRYKALLVEEGEPLAQVCHYIHLNPVRAGLTEVGRLRDYRHSSYWYLWQPKTRPACFQPQYTLQVVGGLTDTPAGWKSYADYLAWQAEEGPVGKSKAYVNLSKGWVLGTADYKATLRADHALAAEARAWTQEGALELRQAQWEERLQQGLAAVGKTLEQARQEPKSAAWKLAVAAWMKACTQANNGWLSARLHLGTPAAFSRNLTTYRRQLTPSDRLWKTLTSISAA